MPKQTTIQQNIYSVIKTAFETDGTLSKYVQEVYDGLRAFDDSFVPQTVKNYIVMEPLSVEETPMGGQEMMLVSSGYQKQLTMTIAVVGVITALAQDKNSFVLDNGKNKGILGLDEDIKNAFDNSDAVQNLSDSICSITTKSFIFETFPKRKVVLEIQISRTFRKGER